MQIVFECAAIQDVLVATGGLNDSTNHDLKSKLKRIVAMLTRMAIKFNGIRESPVDYGSAIDYEHDYEHEHRGAEHEHETADETAGSH